MLPAVNEELLYMLLEYYPCWAESPESFLHFIILYDQLARVSNPSDAGADYLNLSPAAEVLAGIFLKVFHINTGPYRDFTDLKQNCVVKVDAMKELDMMRERSRMSDEFDELASNRQVTPSLETMVAELAHDYAARCALDRIRPYIYLS